MPPYLTYSIIYILLNSKMVLYTMLTLKKQLFADRLLDGKQILSEVVNPTSLGFW